MVSVLNRDSQKYGDHRTWFHSLIGIHKNMVYTSFSSTVKNCSQVDYIGLHRTVMDYTKLHVAVIDYTGLHGTVIDYTELYSTVINYTGLFCTVIDYTELHGTVINYIGLL